MDDKMGVSLQDEIMADLTEELSKDTGFSENVLKSKVISAIREVKLKRNYGATSYTAKKIESDLYSYYSVIKKVALYDYNQIGAEGEKSHNENGISRNWEDREELFSDVTAFVKVL